MPPTDPSPFRKSHPLSSRSGFKDHVDSDWVPLLDLPWYQRWRRGGRLAFILFFCLGVYGVIRGPHDYVALKRWRAQHWLVEMEKANTPDLRREALRKAAALAPDDEAVVRALADFGEATGDPVALQALRQIERRGWERPEDVTRRVRLALILRELDDPMRDLVVQWSKEDPVDLEAERLVIVAQWLAQQGRTAEAVQIVSVRLEGESAGKVRTGLQLQQARLFLQENSTLGPVGAPSSAWSLLSNLIGDEAVPEISRQEAASLLAGSLSHPRRWVGLLTPEAAAEFIGALGTALEIPSLPPVGKLEIDLAQTALRLFCAPISSEEEIRALCGRWRDSTPELRLGLLRWLNLEGQFATAHDWAQSAAPETLPQGWVIARLDAMAGKGAWDQVGPALQAAPPDALSPLLRLLFTYRAARVLAGQTPSETDSVHNARKALLLAAPPADAGELLYAAGNLETAGDLDAALQFFRLIKDREGVAGPARRGIVRCLGADPDRVNELIPALEAVVTQEPRLTEAQGDLIYWRLMEGRAQPEDFKKAGELAGEYPQYLSYRTTAALAALKEMRPAAALAAYDGITVEWKGIPVSWRLVRAAVLVANDRREEAQGLLEGVDPTTLKPGERVLFRQSRSSPPP